LWKAYQKIHRFTDVISYFTTQKWTFQDDNVRKLWEKMSSQDKILFNFDITALDWEVLLFSMGRGIWLYVTDDNLETLTETQARYNRYDFVVFINFVKN
jgi:fatty acyl-CoA reductase